jgi:hypothetical protein
MLLLGSPLALDWRWRCTRLKVELARQKNAEGEGLFLFRVRMRFPRADCQPAGGARRASPMLVLPA